GVAARGYHVSKLIVPTEDIGALIAEHALSDEDSVTAHYNFSLGLAYAPRGGSLSRKLVLACRRDYVCPPDYSGRDWVSAGVDVGRVLHVRISRWPSVHDKAIPHDDVRHLTAPHKVIEKTKEGQKWARYVNDGRADHYFFAETYDLLAHHIRPVPAAGAWGPPPEPAFRGTVFPR